MALNALGREGSLWKPTLILDAGIASEANLAWLREKGFDYIVSARQSPPKQDIDGEFMLVGSLGNVKAAYLKTKGDEDQWLVCHSLAKEITASQMKSLFQQRLELDLGKLKEGLSKPRSRKKYEKILERVGRLREKHKKISGCYEITVTPSYDLKTAVAIEWKLINEQFEEKLTGEYYLRTNVKNKNAKELWDIYNTLRKIEDAFRFMKSALGMRPIYHQKEKRVDGHLWITILAYYLIQDITYRLKKNGIVDEWKFIRNQMNSRIRVTAQAKTERNKTLHIRSTTEPEPYHQKIYNALGISSQIASHKMSFL